jgi:hypothetical protein
MSKALRYLQDIDIRWIYLLTVLLLTYPTIRPIGLPMKISPSTKEVYDLIDALPDGTKMIVEYGLSAGQMYEQGLGVLAVLKQILLSGKDIQLYILAFSAEGPLLFDQMHKPELEKMGLTQDSYGEQWVVLPYIPGLEPAVTSFAKDIHATISNVDFYGTPISNIPMMQEVQTIEDFDIVIESIGTAEIYAFVIRQWATPYGTDIIIISSGIGVPLVMPFYDAGLVIGMVRGLRGCAEYELLIKQPGEAVKNMDSMSLSHLELLAFVILSNVSFWILRREE